MYLLCLPSACCGMVCLGKWLTSLSAYAASEHRMESAVSFGYCRLVVIMRFDSVPCLHWSRNFPRVLSILVGTVLNTEKSVVMLDTSYEPVYCFASAIHIRATFHSEMKLFCFCFHDMNIRACHTGSNQGSF